MNRSVSAAMVPLDPLILPQADPSQFTRPDGTHAGFGEAFTPSMVTASWTVGEGWSDPQITPRRPLAVDPAMVGLHYGQIVFEGLKAYRGDDGAVSVFRPDAYARRMQASARRFAMPEPPVALFVAAVRRLAAVDADRLPDDREAGLYLRPVLFACEPCLALRPATTYLLMCIAFVTGGFFSDAPDPIAVWLEDRYIRAAPGGTGAAKCAGNYAPTYLAQSAAAASGFQQVVWLDARERRWVEELGGMNLFFVYDTGSTPLLTTPPATDTILPGVSRDCILTLAEECGFAVRETTTAVDEWRRDAESGRLTETFACGTAAGITPVGEVGGAHGRWRIGDGGAGPVTLRIRDELHRTQRESAPGRHGWLLPVDSP